MQFFNILALATGIASASAWSSSHVDRLFARGYGLEDASNFFALKARGYDLDVADYTFLQARGYDIEEMADFAVLQARRNKVTIPKKLQKGSIRQNELEETQQLAEAALKKWGGASGEVIYGWHDEKTEDPIEHITIKPDTGKLIHVHRDGTSSQGPPKKGGK